jgi:uncharacterized protein DUF397
VLSAKDLATADLADAVWRKSSRSNGDGNVCVEIALLSEATAIRDSKNPTGGTLVVPAAGWATFRLAALRAGPR